MTSYDPIASPLFANATVILIVLVMVIIFALLIPNVIYEITNSKHAVLGIVYSYDASNYPGFHARRFMQLTRDAFIDVEKILPFRFIGRGIYLLPFLDMYAM